MEQSWFWGASWRGYFYRRERSDWRVGGVGFRCRERVAQFISGGGWRLRKGGLSGILCEEDGAGFVSCCFGGRQTGPTEWSGNTFAPFLWRKARHKPVAKVLPKGAGFTPKGEGRHAFGGTPVRGRKVVLQTALLYGKVGVRRNCLRSLSAMRGRRPDKGMQPNCWTRLFLMFGAF